MKPYFGAILVCFLWMSGEGWAQSNLGDVTFWAISDLTYERSAHPTLIGGRPARPADWPANFYTSSAGGSCTSTLVSGRALATAAHCVGNGKKVTLVRAGVSYEGVCTHHEDYASNTTADYALCLLTQTVPVGAYEMISTDSNVLKKGNNLLLTGFGCTKPGGSGGNDGVYRIGEAKIQILPTGDSNDIVTRGKAALCFGDSGGPAYVLFDGTETGKRATVSINSRGNIYDTSYLSSFSTASAVAFLKKWAADNGQKLCGVHADAVDCRAGS